MTVDKSRTTVFFCFLVLGGPVGGSVAGSACNSTSSEVVETVWAFPAFFLLFFFVMDTFDWLRSAAMLVFVTSRVVLPEAAPRSFWGSGDAVMVVELSVADIAFPGPTLRRFFRFWDTEGVASGSGVICEAFRFPIVGSSG